MAGLLLYWLREALKYTPKTDAYGESLVRKFMQSQLRTSKKLIAALATLFFLLLIDFMCLYILDYLTLKENPGYSFSNFDQQVPIINKVVYGYTGIIISAYFVFYLVAIVVNCKHIKKSALTQKVMFGTGQVMQLIFVVSVVGGVYNEHFANGGVQLFFVGIVNLYMWSLLVLQWPVLMKYREYAVSTDT